jgi:hypothetical protein
MAVETRQYFSKGKMRANREADRIPVTHTAMLRRSLRSNWRDRLAALRPYALAKRGRNAQMGQKCTVRPGGSAVWPPTDAAAHPAGAGFGNFSL